jgi:HEAT repeat protein
MENEAIPATEIAQEIARAAGSLADDKIEKRRDAASVLYDLCRNVGVQASAAIPLLLDLLADDDEAIGESASYGLAYCAPDSIESLIDQLRHPNPKVRRRSCSSLGTIGNPALAASGALRSLLSDPTQEARSRAAWALGSTGDIGPQTTGALLHMIETGTVEDRRAAFHAIGILGRAGLRLTETIQPRFIAGLIDPDSDVRWSVCYALEALDLDPAKRVALFVARLSDDSDRVREIAVNELKNLAEDADLSEHIDAICCVIRLQTRAARGACELIGLLGPRARSAERVLTDAVSSDDPFIAIEGATALWRVTRRADVALPRLASLFEDYGESVCDAICEIGPAAAPLMEQVLAALDSDDWDLQWAAADALGRMGSSDPAVLATLTKALGHESGIVRSAALNALVRVGGPAVPALSETLAQFDDVRADWAADALGRIGHDAGSAVGLLRAGLQSPRSALSGWCAIALGKIAGDQTVVPTLIELLELPDRPDLRAQAALAIKSIGLPADSAKNALRALRDDPDPDVRTAVEEALASLGGWRH